MGDPMPGTIRKYKCGCMGMFVKTNPLTNEDEIICLAPCDRDDGVLWSDPVRSLEVTRRTYSTMEAVAYDPAELDSMLETLRSQLVDGLKFREIKAILWR